MDSRKAAPETVVAGVEARAEEVRATFSTRAKREHARLADSDDSEFWCCLMFRSAEHKRVFLERLGLLSLGDTYVDGHLAAATLGIELPPAGPVARPRPPATRWKEFVRRG
jgi:CO dehydrogenase/acetyl-CoA synthase beta subunit